VADAKTPEEKAAAEKKVKDAEKKFEDAKKEVEAVNKEKEKLISAVADVVVTAMKELKKESESWEQAGKLDEKTAALKQEVFDKQGLSETQETDASLVINIVGVFQITEDEMSAEMKQFKTKAEEYAIASATVKASRIVKAIQQFYNEPASISQLFTTDKALNGSSILKVIMESKQQGKTDKELIATAKESILKQIIVIINAE
jgi:predicted transcriptional regulator YdeE